MAINSTGWKRRAWAERRGLSVGDAPFAEPLAPGRDRQGLPRDLREAAKPFTRMPQREPAARLPQVLGDAPFLTPQELAELDRLPDRLKGGGWNPLDYLKRAASRQGSALLGQAARKILQGAFNNLELAQWAFEYYGSNDPNFNIAHAPGFIKETDCGTNVNGFTFYNSLFQFCLIGQNISPIPAWPHASWNAGFATYFEGPSFADDINGAYFRNPKGTTAGMQEPKIVGRPQMQMAHSLPTWFDPMLQPIDAPSSTSRPKPSQREALRKRFRRLEQIEVKVRTGLSTIPAIRIDLATGLARAVRLRARTSQKAPPGVKERKTVLALRGVPQEVLGALTEGADILDCMYKAIPQQFVVRGTRSSARKRGLAHEGAVGGPYANPFGLSVYEKAEFVWENFEHMDLQRFFECAAYEGFEDVVFGKIGQQTAKANRTLGHPAGVALGPAL